MPDDVITQTPEQHAAIASQLEEDGRLRMRQYLDSLLGRLDQQARDLAVERGRIDALEQEIKRGRPTPEGLANAPETVAPETVAPESVKAVDFPEAGATSVPEGGDRSVRRGGPRT
jgi:hypothetical protein